MAAIDVGTAATDRGTTHNLTYTVITDNNPANDDGTIDTVEIWVVAEGSDVEVATFINEGSNAFSTRDSEALGTVTSGSKQTFIPLDMDILTGDYIGVYGSGGTLEVDDAGGTRWYLSGDQIPCSSATFTLSGTRNLSLYGTGETAGAGTTVTPGLLALSLTLYAPVLHEVTTPTTLALTQSFYAPVLEEVVTPTTLALRQTFYAPVLEEVITPTTLALTQTFYAPVLNEVLTPGLLALVQTFYIPNINVGTIVTPTTLALNLTGYAPILEEVLTPSTLALNLAFYIPVISVSGEILTPGTLELVITGYPPTITSCVWYYHPYRSPDDRIKITRVPVSRSRLTYRTKECTEL